MYPLHQLPKNSTFLKMISNCTELKQSVAEYRVPFEKNVRILIVYSSETGGSSQQRPVTNDKQFDTLVTTPTVYSKKQLPANPNESE
jgi:hypothetical protein